jgi:hypothetical protein
VVYYLLTYLLSKRVGIFSAHHLPPQTCPEQNSNKTTPPTFRESVVKGHTEVSVGGEKKPGGNSTPTPTQEFFSPFHQQDETPPPLTDLKFRIIVPQLIREITHTLSYRLSLLNIIFKQQVLIGIKIPITREQTACTQQQHLV